MSIQTLFEDHVDNEADFKRNIQLLPKNWYLGNNLIDSKLG